LKLLQYLLLGFRGLSINKLRSGLTVLGIVIGVAAVISLMSVGRGAEAEITSRIQSMGSNLLFIYPGAASERGVRLAPGTVPTLTLEDAEALADPSRCPSVALVAPERSGFFQVVAGSENVNTRILAITPEYEQVRNFPVAEGEFITQQHLKARSMVCVLGNEVARSLFGEADPLGQRVKIARRQFRVIGVLEEKGGTSFFSPDEMVVIPLTTALYRLMPQRTAAGAHRISVINVQVVSEDQMEQAEEEIRAVLREQHHLTYGEEDDFTITSQKDILSMLHQATNVLTILLGSIAGISLLVGGIGIMNIMLVTVTERTREIGIRKAVGAKRRDILLQFLIESAILSFSGGLVGILVGWGLSRLIGTIPIAGQTMHTTITPDIILLAVSVTVLIGLFFGIYPAFRAARLNPIEALRYE